MTVITKEGAIKTTHVTDPHTHSDAAGDGGNTIDLNGAGEITLDADGDTSLSSSADDQIDFETGGVDRATLTNNGLALAAGARINEFSTDGTLAGNSDVASPTEKAVKTYVDALLTAGYGTWTPTLSQPGSIGISIGLAAYQIIGNWITVQASIGVTGTGTAANAIVIGGIPAAMNCVAATNVGHFLCIDQGTAFYQGAIYATSTNTWQMVVHNVGNYLGIAPSFALGNTDTLWINCSYLKA